MTDEKPLNVLTICGSLRKGSLNAAVTRALPGLAPAGMTMIAAPPFDRFPLYNADVQREDGFPEPVTALAEVVRAADAVIIVSPEYNYSIPGALKNALDWVSRMPDQPFKGKPVALQSAAPGPLGGSRAQYHMRQVMIFLEALVFGRPEVFVSFAQQRVNEAGELHDEATRKVIAAQLEGFAAYIRRHGGKG